MNILIHIFIFLYIKYRENTIYSMHISIDSHVNGEIEYIWEVNKNNVIFDDILRLNEITSGALNCMPKIQLYHINAAYEPYRFIISDMIEKLQKDSFFEFRYYSCVDNRWITDDIRLYVNDHVEFDHDNTGALDELMWFVADIFDMKFHILKITEYIRIGCDIFGKYGNGFPGVCGCEYAPQDFWLYDNNRCPQISSKSRRDMVTYSMYPIIFTNITVNL
jgi:hypothetical protein